MSVMQHFKFVFEWRNRNKLSVPFARSWDVVWIRTVPSGWYSMEADQFLPYLIYCANEIENQTFTGNLLSKRCTTECAKLCRNRLRNNSKRVILFIFCHEKSFQNTKLRFQTKSLFPLPEQFFLQISACTELPIQTAVKFWKHKAIVPSFENKIPLISISLSFDC